VGIGIDDDSAGSRDQMGRSSETKNSRNERTTCSVHRIAEFASLSQKSVVMFREKTKRTELSNRGTADTSSLRVMAY